MKYTPNPEYRDEYVAILKRHAAAGELHAVRTHINRDGSRTRVTVFAGVVGANGMQVLNVTMMCAHALQEPVLSSQGTPGGIACSSGGTNPVTELQERLSRALDMDVKVYES